MRKFTFYNCIELNISNEDWIYLCKNRWHTDSPQMDDVRAEFISGTGITPNTPDMWQKADEAFHDYINELRELQKIDINSKCKSLLSEVEKHKKGTD